MVLTIAVPRETEPGERRAAIVPDIVDKLVRSGHRVVVEAGLGQEAAFDDDSYRRAGATIAADAAAVWAAGDVIFKVRPPRLDEITALKPGALLIGFVWPAQNPALVQALAARGATVLAMDCIPRLSRAQKMDALSAMANIAGYRAVIEAAQHFGRFFTGQITAAGRVPPAKVFVIGAGVAGLAALGAAVGLGAVVRASDTRPEVADQVKSLGAEFVAVASVEDGQGGGGYAKTMSAAYQEAQRALFAAQARDVDIIITTALIPGKPAPELITEDMVRSMRPGSVIVDLAAEQGGNCGLTVPGQVVRRHGVTIVGYTDLPSRMAGQSSVLYATTIVRLLDELCKAGDGVPKVDFSDDVVRGATVIRDGEVTWPPPPIAVSAPSASASPAAGTQPAPKAAGHGAVQGMPGRRLVGLMVAAGLAFWGMGLVAPPAFLGHLTVFALACFIGYMVVWKVTPSLHTPLMSVTNAISSIIVIGALVQVAPPDSAGVFRQGGLVAGLALLAVALTAINMVGGFAVTRRMLAMFRK